MINRTTVISLSLIFLTACLQANAAHVKDLSKNIDHAWDVAGRQCLLMDSNLSESEMPKTIRDGKLKKCGIRDWVSGFFPGVCWYAYDRTKSKEIKSIAIRQTRKMFDTDRYFHNHDVGFQVMCSAGLAYKYTRDTAYLPVIRKGAEYLASRFSPVTGTIKSWDREDFSYPVIIDNMMNLELLTYAAGIFKRPDWMTIAQTHASTTMANHFRDNGSCYHLLDYDAATGKVLKKQTYQGYADETSWSRGQAWALYGFTMMYRETGNKKYLSHAEKVAAYLLPLLDRKPVPLWDFGAPAELPYDDSSAAAVMASAFCELARLTKDRSLAKACRNMAERIVTELCSHKYLNDPGDAYGFILKHGTGDLPRNKEIDAPLTYGDYYFLEALTRLK